MGFFSCVPTSRMALTYRKKIQKEGNATIDELEQNVAQALYDLEQGSDLKSEMKYLFILSAKEIVVAPNKSAIVVVIPFRQITQFRRIHTRLVHELEKVRQERCYHCATPYFAEAWSQQPCEPPKATQQPNSHFCSQHHP